MYNTYCIFIAKWIFWIEKNLYFQDTHNQAGIAHNGGLVPLLKLLDSKNGSLQHNAAFALYGLADNEVCYNLQIFIIIVAQYLELLQHVI